MSAFSAKWIARSGARCDDEAAADVARARTEVRALSMCILWGVSPLREAVALPGETGAFDDAWNATCGLSGI
jgi:hypothetical protein